MSTLAKLKFPPPYDGVRAKWAPIFVEPILGSGERITIAVAAIGEKEIVITPVPEMAALKSFYGKQVGGVVFEAEAAIEAFRPDLEERGVLALTEPGTAFSGIFVGQIRDGAGDSVAEIAEDGLRLCASLFYRPANPKHYSVQNLRADVRRFVSKKHQSLEKSFNYRFQCTNNARPTRIDFAGEVLVANLGLLAPTKIAESVKAAKAGVCDLETYRERFPERDQAAYELILGAEPSVPEVDEAVEEIAYIAEHQQIATKTMRTANRIGEYIVQSESKGGLFRQF